MHIEGYGLSGSGYGTNICCYRMRIGCYVMCVGCYSVRVQSQFGLGTGLLATTRRGNHPTHVKDLKNPIQLRSPSHNLPLPTARGKVFNQFILAG